MEIILRDSNWGPMSGLPPGWAGEYSNPNTIGFDAHFQMYNDIVDWILLNVADPYNNARWIKIADCIYVDIRQPRDWTLFTLRWGS